VATGILPVEAVGPMLRAGKMPAPTSARPPQADTTRREVATGILTVEVVGLMRLAGKVPAPTSCRQASTAAGSGYRPTSARCCLRIAIISAIARG
jgi:hypothetical protein